jgi:hypothetical protein
MTTRSGVPHAVGDLAAFVDGDRRGDVVGEHQVEVALDQLSGDDLVEPGVGGKDLLCNGHRTRHAKPSSFKGKTLVNQSN